jgi:type I restriction enzyme S subunit
VSDQLPSEWKWTSLREVTSKIGSGATPRGGERAYKRTGIPLIRSMNVHFDGFRPDGLVYLDEGQAAALDGVTVSAGDILLNITGASIGRVTQAPKEMAGARVNQHVCIIRLVENIEPSFIARFLASPTMQTFIAGENYGVTRQALTKEMIEDIKVPIPPLPQQRAILRRLENLFDRTKRARKEVSRIPRLSKRCKEAILAKAMAGDAEGMFPLRPLEDLIIDGPTNGYSPRSGNNPIGTLSLKLTATTRGVLDLSVKGVKRLNEVINTESKFWLKAGDILFQRANSLEYVGVAAIYEGPPKTYIYPDLMIRIRVRSPLLARWIWQYAGSRAARDYFTSSATGTAGNMPKINGGTIRRLMIPFPPTEDRMRRALEKVDRSLLRMDRMLTESSRVGPMLHRLERAILSKVFGGA